GSGAVASFWVGGGGGGGAPPRRLGGGLVVVHDGRWLFDRRIIDRRRFGGRLANRQRILNGGERRFSRVRNSLGGVGHDGRRLVSRWTTSQRESFPSRHVRVIQDCLRVPLGQPAVTRRTNIHCRLLSYPLGRTKETARLSGVY